MRLRHLLPAALLVMAVQPVWALPGYLNVFKRTFAPSSHTPLGKLACATCHTSALGGERNPYGKAVQAALQTAHTNTLTSAILHTIDHLDSDGDGWTNSEEIARGTLPGDPASHPPGLPPNTHKRARIEQTAREAPLVPLHSFHPIVVHFPIALFLFGGLLEFYGEWRRRPDLRNAAFLNLAAAALSAFGAIATGLTALLRQGYSFSGLPLIHLSLAILATLGMGATALLARAALRAGKAHTSPLYWALLGLSILLVSIAGHFGGMIVYGS